MSYGLLLLRVVVGATMFGHGAQKLFGWFGGAGPKGTGGFFGQLGYRAPIVMAILAGVAESSGILFALGFLTPLASLAIAVVMLNAIITPLVEGLLERKRRFRVSARHPDRRRLGGGNRWGVGVLGTALVISFVTVTFGRRREALAEAATT
jgi:hypothetical protein